MTADSKLIVIIEDDAVLRRGLRRAFVKENYRVASFADGSTVFENFRDEKPDLILCDYRLPDTDGSTGLSATPLTHFMTAGTTSATTFKIRYGTESGGDTTFNGEGGGNRRFAGVCNSSITITEIQV